VRKTWPIKEGRKLGSSCSSHRATDQVSRECLTLRLYEQWSKPSVFPQDTDEELHSSSHGRSTSDREDDYAAEAGDPGPSSLTWTELPPRRPAGRSSSLDESQSTSQPPVVTKTPAPRPPPPYVASPQPRTETGTECPVERTSVSHAGRLDTRTWTIQHHATTGRILKSDLKQ
jgi:hypothetical protein